MPVSVRDDSDVVSNPFKTKITVIFVYRVVPALCLFLRDDSDVVSNPFKTKITVIFVCTMLYLLYACFYER